VHNSKRPVDLKYIGENMKKFGTEHDHDKDISFTVFNKCLGELSNGKNGDKKSLIDKNQRRKIHFFTNKFFSWRLDTEVWTKVYLYWQANVVN
jgi:hypothetical protein